MYEAHPYTYADNAVLLCAELETALSTTEQTILAFDLAKDHDDSLNNWIAWRLQYADQIEHFAAATPSQRTAKKKWGDPLHRARLVAAALLLLRDGKVLLYALSNFGYDLSPPNSYRKATSHAGWLVRDLISELSHNPHWPFDKVPSPFAGCS